MINEALAKVLPETAPCTRCKGEGKIKSYMPDEGPRPCFYCRQKKTFSIPDFDEIVNKLTIRRKGRSLWRKSRPPEKHGDRVYYVWRLSRFHSGADVTMPMMAESMLEADPYRDALDMLARVIGKQLSGYHTSIGSLRWDALLGSGKPAPKDAPAAAQSGGPVADEHKPIDEQLELL